MKASRSKGKGGFTLVELMVALALEGIILAIAVPNLTVWLHHAQFQRNEGYARTIYLAAEASLTHIRSTGQWEDIKADLFAAGEPAAIPGEQNPPAHEIRGVLLNGRGPDSEAKERIRTQLLNEASRDVDISNAYICIEVDMTSGHVRTVFYSTTTGDLSYEPGTDGYLGDREYESRLERRLGCYPAED